MANQRISAWKVNPSYNREKRRLVHLIFQVYCCPFHKRLSLNMCTGYGLPDVMSVRPRPMRPWPKFRGYTSLGQSVPWIFCCVPDQTNPFRKPDLSSVNYLYSLSLSELQERDGRTDGWAAGKHFIVPAEAGPPVCLLTVLSLSLSELQERDWPADRWAAGKHILIPAEAGPPVCLLTTFSLSCQN